MPPGELPSQFDGLPQHVRDFIAPYADQGFEDVAALIGILMQEAGDEQAL